MISDVENGFVDIFFSLILLNGFNMRFRSNAHNSGRSACLLFLTKERKIYRWSTIQYGYTKWETHVRVFSQTFAHGKMMESARIKYDKETEEKGKTRGMSMERSKTGTKKEVTNDEL